MEADSTLRRVRQPDAVVRDLDRKRPAVGAGQPDGARARPSVAGDVRQRFLHDAVGGDLDGRRQGWELIWRLDPRSEAVITYAIARGALPYGLDQPKIVQGGGAEVVD